MSPVTVDTSVFMSAFRRGEEGSQASRAFLEKMRRTQEPMIIPTLVLPEAAAVLARAGEDREIALAFVETLARLPHLILIPLDETTARVAADLATTCKLRDADAVYGAVAFRFGCTLVSRDQEQLERLRPVLATRRPEDMLP